MPLHLDGVRTSIGPQVQGGMTLTEITGASSGNVNSIAINYANSVAGINNMRAFTVDLTMGASCAGPYAAYFRTDCVGQQVLGLGAALGMELCLPGATLSSGEFHAMTVDIECAANFSTGVGGKHSFIKMEIWGDGSAKTVFDDTFNLFFLNGLAGVNGNLFDDSFSENTPEIEASLRININGDLWYIPLMDDQHGA